MSTGVIFKALSGFYYINGPDGVIECRAKGKFRHDGMSPLVGDSVEYSVDSSGRGTVESINERKNSFIRPAVANIDTMVFVASASKPVTDPFLIDRVSVIAESCGCGFLLCINKVDLDSADELYEIYSNAPFHVIRTSAETGEGMDELLSTIRGKICAFTGNSGVGKSSILNRIIPGAVIETGEISDKLGRGKHTTRHVELYAAPGNTYIADTPGFASFDVVMINDIKTEDLQYDFPEFSEYIGKCRFNDCRHINEPDCAVIEAVQSGIISWSRHDSYVKLYDIVKSNQPW